MSVDQMKYSTLPTNMGLCRAQAKTSAASIAELQRLGEAGSNPRDDVNPDGQVIHLTNGDFSWVSSFSDGHYLRAEYNVVYRGRKTSRGSS